MIDCKKFHHICQAHCCSVAPIEKDIWERNKHKVVRKHSKLIDYESEVIPETEEMKCVFLNDDLSCNIYEDRPWICRKFGDESNIFLHCTVANKDGKLRSRQDARRVGRELNKATNDFVRIQERFKIW